MKTTLLTSLLFTAVFLLPTQRPCAQAAGSAEIDTGTVEQFSEAVRHIELNSGAYDRQLAEPLESLARLLSEQGEHDQAVQVYNRLLHVSRINDGFYHESHGRIVDRIIAANAAREDWHAVDDGHDYLLWLYQRAYPNDHRRLAAGMQKVLDWKLSFLGLLQGDLATQFLELEEIADQLASAVEGEPDQTHSVRAAALYQRALVHYLYAIAIDENSSTGRRLAARELRHVPPDTGIGLPSDAPLYTNVETRRLILSHLRDGKHIIESIAESAAGDSDAAKAKEVKAMARLYLADWKLLMDKRAAALQDYRDAYSLLLDAGVARERLDAFFSRPVAIPVARFQAHFPSASDALVSTPTESDESDADSDTGQLQLADYFAWASTLPGVGFPLAARPDYLTLDIEHYVELEFDVGLYGRTFKTKDPKFSSIQTAQGNTSRIEIVEDHARGGRVRREVLDEVKLLTFRPRLVDGEPVASAGVRMKYFYSAAD